MADFSPTDIKQLGTIMGIWAHPDDETFCSGGLLAQAAANGQQLICVTATKGEKGIKDPARWPPDQLGEIRASELAKALEILGVQHHHWLNCSDGECQSADSKAAIEQIKALIEKYQPDTILTFGSDGLTGHPDHQAVSAWAKEAAKGRGITVFQVAQLRSLYEQTIEADKRFNIFFNVTRPVLSEESDCQIVFTLPAELLERKCQALQAMPSQYEAMYEGLGEELFALIFSREAFKLAEI